MPAYALVVEGRNKIAIVAYLVDSPLIYRSFFPLFLKTLALKLLYFRIARGVQTHTVFAVFPLNDTSDT